MELIRRDSDYAVRALVAIASGSGFVQAAQIARTQDVPYDFLQKILRKLKTAGLVRAKPGAGGGFALARHAKDITLLEAVEAVQGPVALNRCFLGKGRCPRQKNCSVRGSLEVVQAGICGLLEEITFAELIEGESRQKESKRRS